VETVSPVFDQPEVQDRIAQVLAEQALASGEVEQRITDRLPSDLAFAQPFIAGEIQTVVEGIVRRLLDTQLLGDAREAVLLTLHRHMIGFLEDRDENLVDIQDDQLVLDLRTTFNGLLDRVGVEPARLGGSDGRIADGSRGRIVLVENADALKPASFFVKNRTAIAACTLAASVVVFGAVIFFSSDRRRAALWTAYAVLGVGLLTLLVVFLSNQLLGSAAEERIVSRELVKALGSNLELQSLALMVLGACGVGLLERRIRAAIGSAEFSAVGFVKQVDARIALAFAAVAAVILVLA
jgi:hypothetical protein